MSRRPPRTQAELAAQLNPRIRQMIEDVASRGITSRVPGPPRLTISEADGSPSVSNIYTITVNNGTLTEVGSGAVTLDFEAALDKEAMFNKILTDASGDVLVDASGNLLMEDTL